MTDDIKDIDHTLRNNYDQTIINTNLRYVKRASNLFSVATRADVEKMMKKNSLCSRCGLLQTCEIKKKVDVLKEEMSEQGISSIPVLICKKYQVPIHFKDKTGTNLVEWNTFRFGTTWVNRVRQGEIIALTDDKGRKFGEAEVAHVHCLARETAIGRFSYKNHMLVELGLKPEKAAAQMRRRIVSMYGPAIASTEAQITVIELVRVK